jgi:FMN phosphatase YigB (HAD superfamily)
MFTTVADALGVATEGILHIGDLEPTDVIGAHGVGARAALFAGANDKYLEDTTADHTFTGWDAFIDVLPDLLAAG